jgi:hypothetical protein
VLKRVLAASVAAVCVTVGLLTTASVAEAAPRSKVTLSAAQDRVTAGATLSVAGRVGPAAKRKVTIQRSAGSRWVAVGSKSSNKAGAFSLRVPVGSTSGKVSFRAYLPKARAGRTSYAAAYSKTVRVTVVAKTPPPITPPPPTPPTPGSLQAPYAVGQSFNLAGWNLTVQAADTDAWPEIRAENMFNEAPLPGWSYVMVPIRFSNIGTAAESPFWDVNVDYLGSDRVIYDALSGGQSCGVIPDSWSELNDVYPGGTVAGNACVVVPTSAIARGAWRISTYDSSFRKFEAFVTMS